MSDFEFEGHSQMLPDAVDADAGGRPVYSRRGVLKRALAGGAAGILFPGLLAACEGGETGEDDEEENGEGGEDDEGEEDE